MEAGNVSVRLHHGGPQGAKPKAEVIAKILADMKEWWSQLLRKLFNTAATHRTDHGTHVPRVSK